MLFKILLKLLLNFWEGDIFTFQSPIHILFYKISKLKIYFDTSLSCGSKVFCDAVRKLLSSKNKQKKKVFMSVFGF